MPDYKDIRFLESTNNLREILSKNSNRELSLERANHISVCLEQGRSLFEAAQKVDWEIKPLLVYYGMVGFTKAIVLSRTLGKLESLPRSHGLTDISESALLEEMKVKIEKDGTFQRLNDSCSDLEKLIFHDGNRSKERILNPTCKSNCLVGRALGLKEILSRIPDLQRLYALTFKEHARVVNCSHFGTDYLNPGRAGVIIFEVFDYEPFTDLQSLEQTVIRLRARFPFLEDWVVYEASNNMGIKFANLVRDKEREFLSEVLVERIAGSFSLTMPDYFDTSLGTFRTELPRESFAFGRETLSNHCQPIRGNLTPEIETTSLIEPWEGLFLSELSLLYLGMFLLSSVVRYQPHLWANAIARRSLPQQPLDDHALVIIEEFVDLGLKVFPRATVIGINQPFL